MESNDRQVFPDGCQKQHSLIATDAPFARHTGE